MIGTPMSDLVPKTVFTAYRLTGGGTRAVGGKKFHTEPTDAQIAEYVRQSNRPLMPSYRMNHVVILRSTVVIDRYVTVADDIENAADEFNSYEAPVGAEDGEV